MAASKSQNPSSSSSSLNPENEFRYDIFLSFRGLDTRKKFTDHLYHAMKREGFETFRDDDEIDRGEVIKSELLEAIRSSRMSVVVLSENYANSTACLFELCTILELCKKSDHFVWPVFYEVEPGVLKEQSRNLDFGKKEVSIEKVEGWSAALKQVASMAGTVFRKESDRYEADVIKEIVGKLKTKLAGKHMTVCDHEVGMDLRAEQVNSWLYDRITRVGILVICGMGGIGKTTIAKHIFNSNYRGYDAACFLLNISQVAERHGLVRLQTQLLSDILGKKECQVNDVYDGCRRMKYALRNKRVLLVLDDVDQMDQLFALAGRQEWFSPGSKIIITSRLESVVNGRENYEVYRPVELNRVESLELFSWHAFGQKYPIQSHQHLSERFVQYCDGNPLALEVLGCSIRRKTVDVLESELKKLEATSNNTILEKLEISYSSLKDDHDKNLFLDIACFFVGKKKNETITILEGCDFALAGIYNLVDRNLLSIQNDHLQMHQLLQDMGKQIIWRESKYAEKRSRIWRHKESSNILLKQIGTEAIEGLALDMNMLRDSNPVVFQTSTFEKMYNLRLLKLNSVKFSGTCKAFPKSLRWLYWRGFPSESIPNEFPLENLVSLDMRYSNLKQVWKGTKVLGSLKILNLSYSFKLAKTPDFSRFPKLEKLVLKACPCLFEVDESISGLQHIELINLKDCKNLRKLPRNIGMLDSLVEIDISGCSNLTGAIEELEKMKSLRVLKASRMETDCWLTVEVASQASIWPWIPKPRVRMSLASLPSSLVQLNLSNSNLTDDAFPKDLTKLSKLRKLFLCGNLVSRLPNFIKDLTGLQTLGLSNCQKLQQIHWSSTNLVQLIVNRCRALQNVTCETGTSITKISFGRCCNVNYVEGYFKIFPVREVDLELINSIGFFNLDSMADLSVELFNFQTGVLFEKYPIQIVNDNDSKLIYTFFPGEKAPHWFSNTNSGSTISFNATLSPHFAFRGLNLYALYTLLDDFIVSNYIVIITNKRSGKKTVYGISIHGIPEKGQHMIWLSHCFEENLFTEGDEVEVSFIFPGAQIKECGVHLLYFEEEGEVFQYLCNIQRLLEPNLSPHEPEAGVKEGKEEPCSQNQRIYLEYPEEWDYISINCTVGASWERLHYQDTIGLDLASSNSTVIILSYGGTFIRATVPRLLNALGSSTRVLPEISNHGPN